MIDIGVDLLKISRIDALLNQNIPELYNYFTEQEHRDGKNAQNKTIFYAERFVCKEAVFKCFNLTMDTAYLQEIETLNNENGKPNINLYGRMAEIARQRGVNNVNISISYEDIYVIAFALIESEVKV